MKYLSDINRILSEKGLTTKVKIYFSTKAAGDDYDGYEANYVYTNLNPITIKAYVREITPESAFWKQYGLHQAGMKEIICYDKYKSYFENANKIEIDSIEYQTFKGGTGSRTLITKRPFKMLRVVVSRKD